MLSREAPCPCPWGFPAIATGQVTACPPQEPQQDADALLPGRSPLVREMQSPPLTVVLECHQCRTLGRRSFEPVDGKEVSPVCGRGSSKQ